MDKVLILERNGSQKMLLDYLGYSFNDILIDVRMSIALTLIQVTDTPIPEIAYQVGYDSASRFTARLKLNLLLV